jgi:SPP1 gp7 family putative phage head morphogenesis protein
MSMDDESEAMASQLAKLMATEVERVYKSKAMPSLNQSITHAYANIFSKAIEKGYGVNLNEIDYNSTDANAITNLIESAYHFSAAKNYTQLRQLTAALVDDKQKLRSFSEFKKAAYTITDAHNNKWLKTEYNTAIASAQMASKWQDIQANKNTLPLLQMDVILDTQTSATCKPLEGVIKPIGDPFWATYYPPNHFGCRSTVRQLAKGKITPDHEIVHPEKVPPMFKTNLAITGNLFPNDHPYFIGVPQDELDKRSTAYKLDATRAGRKGNVYISGRAMKESKNNTTDIDSILEYESRRNVADLLANHFNSNVFITPEGLNEKNPLYKIFFKDTPVFSRCPDFKIENEFWELKGHKKPFHKDTIGNIISRACHKKFKQSNRLIIKLNEKVDEQTIKNKVAGELKGNRNVIAWLKEIVVVNGDNTLMSFK